MTEQGTFQLQGNAAQIYEEQKVPTMFRPLAELTLRHVDVREGARVLDVACGTGIVGRLVAEKVGNSGTVVGVDLNAGMIEVARQTVTDVNIEWHQSDVADLPFADDSFDIAFCQQGLQFFPDKLAALTELRRVLTPSGSLILTVWSSVSPLSAAIADATGRYVGDEASKSALSPFAFRDLEVIKGLLVDAGFAEVDTEILVLERRIGPPEESIPKAIASSPVGVFVGQLDDPSQEALFHDVSEALRDYLEHDGMVIPEETHLVRAISP